MKTFPSIRQSRKPFKAHIFDKLDGTNLRFSWNKKEGWYEYATRTRPLPADHKLYQIGYEIFLNKFADKIVSVASRNNWKRLDVFFEFYGENSFAGRHDLNEKQTISMIDLAPNTRGFLNPLEFLDLFNDLKIATYLGEADWNEDYIEAVRAGLVEGMTFEGVVAKAENKQRMAKAKTQKWIDKVIAEYGEVKGGEIIKS